MYAVDALILLGATLLMVAILWNTLSSRIGVPGLVIFLAVGMLAGEDGIGRIAFDAYPIAHAVGTLALVLILFDGGLQTPWRSFLISYRASWLLLGFRSRVPSREYQRITIIAEAMPNPAPTIVCHAGSASNPAHVDGPRLACGRGLESIQNELGALGAAVADYARHLKWRL